MTILNENCENAIHTLLFYFQPTEKKEPEVVEKSLNIVEPMQVDDEKSPPNENLKKESPLAPQQVRKFKKVHTV